MMNRYWLDQNGRITGPFAEEILLDMWKRGEVARDAQVCLEDTEEWLDANFIVNEITMANESPPAWRMSDYGRFETTKKPSQAKAVGLFIAAILMGACAWLVRGPREQEMGNDTVLLFFAAVVVVTILAICLLMVRGGMAAGLITLVFVVLITAGTVSRLKFEASKRENERQLQEMQRLLRRIENGL